MMVLVLLCVMLRLYCLASTVNDWFVDGWLVCRSRCSISHLTQVEILIRSVHIIRHSADISMLMHGDWSKIMHDIVGMMIVFDPVVDSVSLCYGRIIYGPSLLLELLLGRRSSCLLVLLLFLGWLCLSWLRWLLLLSRLLLLLRRLGWLLLGGMQWLSLLGLLLMLLMLLLGLSWL